MRILYIIGKILTFPGSFLRCFWEHLTAKILRLPVEKSSYLSFDESCGHIEHSLTEKGFASYLMATGPGFMNMITGWPLLLMGYLNLKVMGITPYDSIPLFVFYVISTYIGISLLCCQFPLIEDALNLWDVAYGQKKMNIVGRILAFIPALVTRIGAFLESLSVPVIFWIAASIIIFVVK